MQSDSPEERNRAGFKREGALAEKQSCPGGKHAALDGRRDDTATIEAALLQAQSLKKGQVVG